MIRQDFALPTAYPYERLCQHPAMDSGSLVCDWWSPEQRAQFERKYGMPADLRGMGIDACGLPEVLRGFSATGWRLELTATGKIRMFVASHAARNENGSRDYLQTMQDRIRGCLECLNGATAVCGMEQESERRNHAGNAETGAAIAHETAA